MLTTRLYVEYTQKRDNLYNVIEGHVQTCETCANYDVSDISLEISKIPAKCEQMFIYLLYYVEAMTMLANHHKDVEIERNLDKSV